MTSNSSKLLSMSVATLAWGSNPIYSVPVAALPESAIVALMQRGFNHIIGNEAASYATGLKGEMIDGPDRDPETNEFIPVRKYSDDEIAVMLHDRRTEKVADILAGEIGLRAVGPRLPKDERIMREFAKNVIVAKFAERPNLKAPKASDTKAWDNLIDQYLATETGGTAARKEAERQLSAATKGKGADDFLDAMLAKAG